MPGRAIDAAARKAPHATGPRTTPAAAAATAAPRPSVLRRPASGAFHGASAACKPTQALRRKARRTDRGADTADPAEKRLHSALQEQVANAMGASTAPCTCAADPPSGASASSQANLWFCSAARVAPSRGCLPGVKVAPSHRLAGEVEVAPPRAAKRGLGVPRVPLFGALHKEHRGYVL